MPTQIYTRAVTKISLHIARARAITNVAHNPKSHRHKDRAAPPGPFIATGKGSFAPKSLSVLFSFFFFSADNALGDQATCKWAHIHTDTYAWRLAKFMLIEMYRATARCELGDYVTLVFLPLAVCKVWGRLVPWLDAGSVALICLMMELEFGTLFGEEFSVDYDHEYRKSR